MAIETGSGARATIERVQSIDFVNQFQGNLAKILEAMGVTRKLPLSAGDTIKRYVTSASMQSGTVAEGDVIPLSTISEVAGASIVLSLKKFRRQATAENIQANGYQKAIIEADAKLLREIQSGMRTDFFTFLATGTGTATADTFQSAIAQAWAGVNSAFEDDAVDTICFVNPIDVADYLGTATISVQEVFGMQYLTGFTGIKGMFVSPKVAQGTLIATASSNVVLAYIDVNGELSKAFTEIEVDPSGYIGVFHDVQGDRLAVDTVAMTGATLFAEVMDGVIVIDFASVVSA